MKTSKNPVIHTLPYDQTVGRNALVLSNGYLFMEEIWKDVKGYEGRYQISNLANLRSVARKANTKGGSQRNVKATLIRYYKNKMGYYSATLCKGNIKKTSAIHRIVAISFIPNPDNKPCINHKNGIKTDNSVENLEWCTLAENNYHARVVLGVLNLTGSESHNAIKVKAIFKDGTTKIYGSMRDASNDTGVLLQGISAVVNKKSIMGKWHYKTAGGIKFERI